MRSDLCGCLRDTDLARAGVGLQEALMDGVLQKLLLVVGLGCMSAASSAMITGGHLKHGRTNLKQRQRWKQGKKKERKSHLGMADL